MNLSRASSRGAAMTEAVIVISFFIVALSGVVYFREMYMRKILTMRVARAATIQYALGGCKGNPAGAVSPDMRGITATSAHSDESVPSSHDTSSGMASSSEARSATKGIAGTSGFFLNPIANVGMAGNASVGSRTRSTFRSTMATSSYASCPDQVKPHNQDFIEVIGYISGLFGM